MIITTPKGTVTIIRKSDLALEKIKEIEQHIDSLSVVSISNTKCMIGSAILGITGIGIGIVANVRAKRLTRQLSEQKTVHEKEEV